ncbi:MAG: Minf_1886 family protein [Phycisphaerales bacterium JB060]
MEELIDWQRMRALAPFSPEAFRFVQEGLQHTLEQVRGQNDGNEGPTGESVEDDTELDLALLGEIAGVEPGDLEEISASQSRHVSGQELCLGLRSLAVEKYGLLARTVLRGWGLSTTEDFGKIVYAMVDTGLLRTSENDSLDDFRGVYEFDEAFDGPLDRCANGPGAATDEAGGLG